MFVFVLQMRHMLEGQSEIYLFAVFSALVWVLWVLKVVLSRRYKPSTEPYTTTTSVVIPVVDEPLDLFRDVLHRIVEQRPDEVIVVINGKPNPALEQVSDEFAPLVRWVHTPIPGKRNAVKIGTELSRGDITVLVDSDTIWTEGTLPELVKPFADPSVGGVTTRQRILEPERSWITRWADWLENSRALYSMPAQSALGQIGCLPGRTIAFRRHILVRVMDKFMHERFMGVFLEVSDDRTLTNLTLKAGYRTVYQYTSLVYTDAPLQVKKLFKQQLRWARGSQYNTLRMLPWMLGHAPVLAVFFLTDILLPFLLVGAVAGWVYRAVTHTGVNLYEAILTSYTGLRGWVWVIGLMIASSVLSMAIRQIRHLHEKPSDFFRLPVFIIVSTFFLMPVRLLGFVRMAHASGWGTRAGAYAGGDQGDLMAQLEDLRDDAPRDVVDRTPPHGIPYVGAGTDTWIATGATTSGVARPGATDPEGAPPDGTLRTRERRATDERTRRAAQAAPTRPARRRLNPYAAIPYAVAALILAAEASLYV